MKHERRTADLGTHLYSNGVRAIVLCGPGETKPVDLSMDRPIELRSLDVNEIVTDAVRFVGDDARRSGITLRADLQPALPRVHADRDGVREVLVCLLLNAMDSMEQVVPIQRRLVLQTRYVAGCVELTVKDAGRRVARAELGARRDVHAIAKQIRIGLGLAIARSIIEAHRGRLWGEDHGGRGATFHVTLPGPTEAASVARGCAPRSAASRWAESAAKWRRVCTL